MPDPTTQAPSSILGAVNSPMQQQGAEPSQRVKDYISNGMSLIHSKQMQETIVSRLEGDDDVKALSDLTLSIVDRLDQSAAANKVKIDDDVKWQGASIFMEQLVDVGTAAGVIDVTQEDIKKAAGDAVGRYMQQGLAKGTITEEDMRQAYKVIQANNPDVDAPLFDAAQTPGMNETSTPITPSKPPTQMPQSSPKPSALGGA